MRILTAYWIQVEGKAETVMEDLEKPSLKVFVQLSCSWNLQSLVDS